MIEIMWRASRLRGHFRARCQFVEPARSPDAAKLNPGLIRCNCHPGLREPVIRRAFAAPLAPSGY